MLQPSLILGGSSLRFCDSVRLAEDRREDDLRGFCHNYLSKRLKHQLHEQMAASGPVPDTRDKKMQTVGACTFSARDRSQNPP